MKDGLGEGGGVKGRGGVRQKMSLPPKPFNAIQRCPHGFFFGGEGRGGRGGSDKNVTPPKLYV